MVSRVPDLFDELNEDLRAERNRALLKRYGGFGVALMLVAVLAVGGWQAWEWQTRQKALAAAGPYLDASRQAAALPGGPSRAIAPVAEAFAKIEATGPEGYRTLSRLREAAVDWDGGDHATAMTLWDQVGNDGDADPILRDLGTLLWAQHAVDDGDPAAIAAHTAKLEAGNNPWRSLAVEVDALLALRQNDKEKAITLFRTLAVNPLAPDGLRGRASALLTLLGAAPEARG